MKKISMVIISLPLFVLIILFIVAGFQRPVHDKPFFRSLPRKRPLVIAHRGGAKLYPENTMTAFTGAVESGVDVLELDVRLTADNILVVIHDETIDRTTDGTGPVSGFTLDELRQFDAGYRFAPPGEPDVFPYRNLGIRIPALRDVFTEFPETPLIVEVKEERSEAADALMDLIREFDRADITLPGSFHRSILVHFRSRLPLMASHASEREVIPFLAASWFRLEGLVRPDYEALIVPVKSGAVPVATKRFIRAANKRNLFVAIWTINDPDQMRRLIQCGADALITDRPDLAMQIIRD